ncbi:MAG: hypothetical protein PVI03_04670 [Candidatus Thorarchaeota archaeon]|jgi:hypothetical protein
MSELVKEELARIRLNLADIARGPSNRLRSPSPAVDIDGFYALVGQALQTYQLAEGRAEDKLIIYTEEYPPENYERETITVRLRDRGPAVMSKTAPRGQPRELKPNVREVYDDPILPRYQIWELGWMRDNIIEFCMWSQTNKEANKMALWFEDFMHYNMWFFRSRGVNQLYFNGRDEDFKILDKRLVGRPLTYFVRTERIFQLREKVLEELIVNAIVTTDQDAELSDYSED